MPEIADSVKGRAEDKGVAAAMKMVEVLFTPFRPTFEMDLDRKGLSLAMFGLLNRVDKAQMLLDELTTIYSDWHLSRP